MDVSPGDIKTLLAQEPRCQDLLQRLGRVRGFDETGDIWACLGGVILLAIGKQVNPDGYTNWFTKRCTAFAGSLGNPNIVSFLKATTAPSLGSMVLINSYLSACRELRGDIFRLVLRGAQADGRNSNTLKDIAMLLKGAEMSHICMIDEYLYCRYPEILLIRPLHDNSEAMSQAWEYLATIPQDERYYVKLLRPKSETDLLNRNNFLMHNAAALAAAKFESPTMANMKMTLTDAGEKIAGAVTQYLSIRQRHALLAMGDKETAKFSDRELSTYLDVAMSIISGVDKEDSASAQRT